PRSSPSGIGRNISKRCRLSAGGYDVRSVGLRPLKRALTQIINCDPSAEALGYCQTSAARTNDGPLRCPCSEWLRLGPVATARGSDTLTDPKRRRSGALQIIHSLSSPLRFTFFAGLHQSLANAFGV